MRRITWALAVCGIVGLGLGVSYAQDRYSDDRDSGFRQLGSSALQRKLNFFSRARESEQSDNADDQTNRDPFTSQRPHFVVEAEAPSNARPQYDRLGRQTAASREPAAETRRTAPQLKNYHQELFGTPPQDVASSNPQYVGRQAPRSSKTNRLDPSVQRAEFSGQRKPIGRNSVQTSRAPLLPSKSMDGSKPRNNSARSSDISQAAFEKDPFETDQSKRAIQADYDRPAGSSERGKILPVRATKRNNSPFKSAAQIARERKTTTPAAKKSTAPRTRKVPQALSKQEIKIPLQNSNLVRKHVSRSPSVAVPNFSQNLPNVTLKWAQRSQFNVGQNCVCDLLVENTGQVAATDIEVAAYFPASIRLTSASPEPSEALEHLVWRFPKLAPGEEQAIQVSMIPSGRGKIDATATVRFTGASSTTFNVEEPMLSLVAKGPNRVHVGESASQIVTISNPGTGIAQNVVLEVQVPKGLEHIRGERLFMEIGSLNPSESRDVRLSLSAIGGGPQAVGLKVSADASLSQTASARIEVIAPSVKVAVDGPGLRYLGRNASYTLTVTNDGAVVTNNVRATHKLPAGFKFVSAQKSGKFDPATKTISWFVGRLGAGQSMELSVRLATIELGKFVHRVRVTSEHGVHATAQTTTAIEGTASLILEIVELDDPVEIGKETAYEIRVSNKGSKEARSVGVACELPIGVMLVKAKGATSHVVQQGQVVFKTLPSLAPGKTALFEVLVRGEQEGNHRFRARLTSDSIKDPLTFEELTKFYSD